MSFKRLLTLALLICVAFPGHVNAAVEDYTTYTPATNTSLTVIANDITVTAMPRNEDSRLSKDFGAGFFGDISVGIDFETVVDSVGANGTFIFGFGLSNTADSDVKAHFDGNLASIWVDHGVDAGGQAQIVLFEIPTITTDIFSQTLGVRYYCRFTRSGATPILRIYTDAARTALVDTLTVTATAAALRYMYAFNTFKDALVATITGNVSNHEILSSGYISVADSQALRMVSGGTIAAWINATSAGGSSAGRVIDKGDGGVNGYALITKATQKMSLTVGNVASDTGNNVITFGTWACVVATFDSSGRKMYIDGSEVTLTNASDTTLPGDVSGSVFIGRYSTGEARSFDGFMDESLLSARIWSNSEAKYFCNATRGRYIQ